MKKHTFAILSFLILLISSCSKEKENPSNTQYMEDYRFFMKGKIGGMPVEYNAGEDSYFMETSYVFRDSVVEMTGTLAPEGLVLQNAFVIKIRSKNSIFSLDQFQPDENLSPGPLAFRDATGFRAHTGNYVLSLFCDTLSQYQNFTWVFPDGSISNNLFPVKNIDVNEYAVYPVKLQTTGPFGCSAELIHEINIKEDCDATFDVTILANFTAAVELENVIGEVQEVKWYLNGDAFVPDSVNGSVYLGNTGSSHEITCEVIFVSGCTKTITRTIGANFASNCITGFHYQKEKEKTYDPQQLATVELLYYDENGKEYTSYYDDVMGNFEIKSSTPFGENPKGEATTRFFFETDAVLISKDGSSVELKDGFGSFAVAHP